MMDVKIYVDTDADLRILRRLTRDTKERGRSMDSVINQYLSVVDLCMTNLLNRLRNMLI